MRLLSRPLRRIAAGTLVAVSIAGGGIVASAAPAAADHVAAMTVTQAGNQGAYVTLQVDLTYTASNVGGGYFQWNTGNGRTGSVTDGVLNGAYSGDASGSGTFYGGTGVMATYTWTRTQPSPNISRTRITYPYPQAGIYQVSWSDCCPDVNGTTAVSVAGGFPACSDTLDNDNDGKTDYPDDPGCESPEETSEKAECPPVSGVVFCLAASPIVVQRVTAHSVDVTIEDTHVVVGSVDLYDFTANNVTVTLPCVVLATTGTNACERAGGRFASRLLVLAEDVPTPGVTIGPALATVAICEAELAATVQGVGVTSAPAYTVCEAGTVSL